LQKGRCAVCREALSKSFHRDHRIALANGGSNDKSNLQLLCKSCNSRKHKKDPIRFMQENGYLL
jgi:5-methylcytosine-specific restriction endonuclease McrA